VEGKEVVFVSVRLLTANGGSSGSPKERPGMATAYVVQALRSLLQICGMKLIRRSSQESLWRRLLCYVRDCIQVERAIIVWIAVRAIAMQNTLLHGDHCQGSGNRPEDREVIVHQISGIALSLACA